MKQKRRVAPVLYVALFEIALMRDEVRAIRGDLADEAAARFLSRLDAAEREALRLIERVERGRSSVPH